MKLDVNRAAVSRVQPAIAPRSEDSDPMTTIVILAAITATGVYLRWATGPVLAAYQVGRQVERIIATLNGGTGRLDRASRMDR
jgi:hypothetical protein